MQGRTEEKSQKRPGSGAGLKREAKNVLAQGPDTAVCESRNKLAVAQTKFRSAIHKLSIL